MDVPFDEDDKRPVYRTEKVRVNHCDHDGLHAPHEKTWSQTDPSGKQESFVRIDYCPGTGRLV